LSEGYVQTWRGCDSAIASGEFAAVRRLADIAGDKGAFAIRLALKYPNMRVALTERSGALDEVRQILTERGLEDRIELREVDIVRTPWEIPECDGIIMGNLHAVSDEKCHIIYRYAFEHLAPRGRVWVHERIRNEGFTAAVGLALLSAARPEAPVPRRTVEELKGHLRGVGFQAPYFMPTEPGFALLSAERP
jgi:hypothetical protein